jgi:hypothetical protein
LGILCIVTFPNSADNGPSMASASLKLNASLAQTVLRHRAWILVGLTLLLVLTIRVRLREMPLERDEGEYAYAGQLILKGVPPYKEAYNMKLPGTYAAYALIMLLFGQSASGIHLGLAVVNASSIVLIFLIGRKLLDPAAGVAAAIAFAFMSISPSVLGLAGHATHFVVLAALAGFWVLLRAMETQRKRELFVSGIFFGLAFLMKQHGVFFAICAGIWTSLFGTDPSTTAERNRRRKEPAGQLQTALPGLIRNLAFLAFGVALPYLLTCLILWAAGVFNQFFFWTFSYAGKYASVIPADKGMEILRTMLRSGVGPSLMFWILPAMAAIIMWWETRLPRHYRVLLVALFLCSAAAVSVGFYFRGHYFILMLPVLSWMTGVAISRGIYLLKHDQTIELFITLPMLGLFVIGPGAMLVEQGGLFFNMTPAEAVRSIYSSSLFSETLKVAQYLKAHVPKGTRIAVLGSEPEIYFYSRLPSATGYIYTYPLMEKHAYAVRMQDEMIAEIEKARPEYVIYIEDDFSWLRYSFSEGKIFDWWKEYWSGNLDLITTMPVETEDNSGTKFVLLFKRKSGK